MTNLPSPDECRARAARLRARALSQTTEPNVREALEEANVWEAIGAEMERRNFKPTTGTPHAARPPMDTASLASAPKAVRIAHGVQKERSQFREALYAKGLTLSSYAKRKGWNRISVQAWDFRGARGRKIPKKCAEQVERDLGIPLSYWPNGVGE